MSRPQSAALPIALAGLAALAISQGIGRFAMTPILPMMQQEGLSLAQGGWLAAANYLGYLAGALSTIWLGHKSHHRDELTGAADLEAVPKRTPPD